MNIQLDVKVWFDILVLILQVIILQMTLVRVAKSKVTLSYVPVDVAPVDFWPELHIAEVVTQHRNPCAYQSSWD